MNKHELIGRIVRIAQDEMSGLRACDNINERIDTEGFELVEKQRQSDVVGRSEQLLVFAKWIQENGNHMTPEKQVKYFLDDNK